MQVVQHKDRFKFHKSSVFWDLLVEPDLIKVPKWKSLKGVVVKEELDAA